MTPPLRFPGRPGGAPRVPCELLEIVTPRTNAAALTPAENLLSAIALDEWFSLEVAATARQRWFLARSRTPAMGEHLREQLGVAYPQADLRPLDTLAVPGLDPARRAPGERAAACALVLRGPAYLPLHTFAEPDVAADRARHAAQADPVLGILGALGTLPAGWRALAQLVLRPAPDGWARPYLRLAVEHPLAAERAAAGGQAGPSQAGMVALAVLLGAGAVALRARRLWETGRWPELALLAAGVAGGVAGLLALVWLARRLTARPVYDPRLVQQKLAPPAFAAQLRLAVFAPAGVAPAAVEARLRALAAAYRQFDLAAGNGLRPRRLRLPQGDPDALCGLRALGRGRLAVLNARELAGLWHLPQTGADAPLVERTRARERPPLPADVDPARGGCPVGVCEHQGRAVPVALPDDLLRRHLLLVAKTRRGKSTLLARLAQHLMAARAPGEAPPALVLVDPHRDLARAVLGLVPPARQENVVALSLADAGRPFGLNLLDVGLGWDRDKAVSNALLVFRREFDAFWGPRMEDAFRFALLSLYEANEALCAADPGPPGRARQHTVLQVPTVLGNAPWRQSVLPLVRDPVVLGWWTGYFERLDRRLQTEVINPVATKVQRFAGSLAARHVVGQARSTLDPRAWVRDGAVVVVDAAKGVVGEDTAALVGATLINLVALAVGEQAALPPRERRRVCLVVDEFHAMPGADYEALLSELAKYGASLVLATQSLARLGALDRQHQRALRPAVFANLDGLFAFHCSAEDARYLVRELGSAVDEEDLLELGEHRCYARLSAGGGRLPLFSLRLDPPPASDDALAARLATRSARRHGREVATVEAEIAEVLARIAAARPQQAGGAPTPGTGDAHDPAGAGLPPGEAGSPPADGGPAGGDSGSSGEPPEPEQKARNDNRPGRNESPSPPVANGGRDEAARSGASG